MIVADILSQKGQEVYCVDCDTKIPEAAGFMASQHIGAVLVVDDNGLQGIISERDLAYGIKTIGAGIFDMTVNDLMSKAVITCAAETTIAEAVEIMAEHEIRHLPVINDGKVVGLIGMRDVMNERVTELQFENEALRDQLSSVAA